MLEAVPANRIVTCWNPFSDLRRELPKENSPEIPKWDPWQARIRPSVSRGLPESHRSPRGASRRRLPRRPRLGTPGKPGPADEGRARSSQ